MLITIDIGWIFFIGTQHWVLFFRVWIGHQSPRTRSGGANCEILPKTHPHTHKTIKNLKSKKPSSFCVDRLGIFGAEVRRRNRVTSDYQCAPGKDVMQEPILLIGTHHSILNLLEKYQGNGEAEGCKPLEWEIGNPFGRGSAPVGVSSSQGRASAPLPPAASRRWDRWPQPRERHRRQGQQERKREMEKRWERGKTGEREREREEHSSCRLTRLSLERGAYNTNAWRASRAGVI